MNQILKRLTTLMMLSSAASIVQPGWVFAQAIENADAQPLVITQTLIAQTQRPKIQIAILLDASNSMDGLIDQARSQIWEIINALTTAEKANQNPELEVALYQYGKSDLPSSEGYLQLLTGFTDDLDLVSENLFAIRTQGGQEYAGWAIQSAIQELNWSTDRDNFRVIFIAGNEPFNQGPVPYQEALAMAVAEDALVNTVYCGSLDSSERDLWAEGAAISGGKHAYINHDRAITIVETPYDMQISLLNQQLNETYIPYGEYGIEGQQRQLQEDLNASTRGVGGTRGAFKASDYYRNASWDLLDALDEGVVQLETLETEALPANLQGMNTPERLSYIEQKQTEREELQAQIQSLTEQRQNFIAQQQSAAQPTDTFEFVMIEILQEQLAEKGFTLSE